MRAHTLSWLPLFQRILEYDAATASRPVCLVKTQCSFETWPVRCAVPLTVKMNAHSFSESRIILREHRCIIHQTVTASWRARRSTDQTTAFGQCKYRWVSSDNISPFEVRTRLPFNYHFNYEWIDLRFSLHKLNVVKATLSCWSLQSTSGHCDESWLTSTH